jgi:hypothetical protein
MGFDESKVEAISAQLGVQDTIKLFSRVGKAGSEPSFVGGERSANTQSIDEQIQEIYNNPWSTTWAPVPVIGSSEINGLNIEPP